MEHMKGMSKAEALEKALEYFDGDAMVANVFIDKYALRDNAGTYYEGTYEELAQRMAREFARIEAKYPNALSFEEILDYLTHGQNAVNPAFPLKTGVICPQGSPMFAVGNRFQIVSTSNCSVIASPQDTMSSIVDTARDMANLYKRRFGVGLDISTLRPSGATVNNAAGTSSGAWSFADFYSFVTRMVGQSGRRGALLLSIDVRHPDVEHFITMKKDLTKVTGANVSVRLTDAFMQAVEQDADFTLQFPVDVPVEQAKVTRTIKAKALFELIAETACQTAEPGVFFWDRTVEHQPMNHYPGYEVVSTNPCVTGDTMVRTSEGLLPVSELVGVPFYAEVRERIDPSLGGFFSTGVKPVIRIHTSSDHTVVLTPNHRMKRLVGEADEMVEEWVEAGKLVAGDRLVLDEAPFLTEFLEATPEGEQEVFDVRVEAFHHSFSANGFVVHNCGEQSLPPYDSCRLMSVYLAPFVCNEFLPDAYFDFVKFRRAAKVAQRLADDLVDLELEKLREIHDAADTADERELFAQFIKMCEEVRRTGLGTHGLGDCLARLGIPYGSEKAVEVVRYIYCTLANAAYESSVEMAGERGAFPVWDWEKERNCSFFHTALTQELCENMAAVGRRNGVLLTNAPTGTRSLLSENCSSGIEPVFANSYTRRRKIDRSRDDLTVDLIDGVGDAWKEYQVFHPNVERYLRLAHKSPLLYGVPNAHVFYDVTGELLDIPYEQFKEQAELPSYFVTADQIHWGDRVVTQGVIQIYIDNSISSTINLPSGTEPRTVAEIYRHAWKRGLKGVTVYVDGSRQAQVLSTGTSTKAEPSEVEALQARIAELEAQVSSAEALIDARDVGVLDRGDYTSGEMLKANFTSPTTGQERKVYVYAGRSEQGRLVEVFVHDERGDEDLLPYAQATGRLVSLLLKHGVDPKEVAGALRGLKGGATSYRRGGMATSVPDLVSQLILEVIGERKNKARTPVEPEASMELEYEIIGVSGSASHAAPSGVRLQRCMNCQEDAVKVEGGCETCTNCGSSRCS